MHSSSSKTEPPGGQPLPDTIAVARLLRARGLAGELVAAVLSDVPGRLDAGAVCQLTLPGRAPRAVEITASRPHPQGVLLRLRGIEDRDAADAVRGAELEIARPAASPRPAGAFFEYELIGCRCWDRVAGDLGVLVDMTESGGGALLRIEGPPGVLLVPFVESFLERVDVAARRIDLVLPAGLIETCASRS